MDDESLFEAIKVSDKLSSSGAWYTLSTESGDVKFQPSRWAEKMQEPAFKEAVLKIIDDEVIRKFDNREGDASGFYNTED